MLTVIELYLFNKEHNSMLMLKLQTSLGAQRWSFLDINDDQQCSSFKRKVNSVESPDTVSGRYAYARDPLQLDRFTDASSPSSGSVPH